MAVSVGNITTAAGANGITGTVTLSVPSGTANGDLLLLQLSSSSTGDIAAPTGWTAIESLVSGAPFTAVFYRLASSEPASYAITKNSSPPLLCAMLDVKGPSLVTVPDTHHGQNNSSASTTATVTGITPSAANEMIFLFFAAAGGTTFASYAIATSSPTFTEAYDFTANSVIAQACAYGVRSVATATGNGTATISSLANTGIIISIIPQQDQAPSAPLYNLSLSAFMFPFNLPRFTLAASLFAVASSKWRTVGKHLTTWRNKSKS